MASSTSEKNLGLANPRWRMYIKFMKEAFDRWDKMLNEILMRLESVLHALSMELGSHVSPWRQTDKQASFLKR